MGSTAKQDNYLTKRRLKSATAKAIKKASIEAYEVTDSVVTVKNGWVVRQFKNGKTKVKLVGSKNVGRHCKYYNAGHSNIIFYSEKLRLIAQQH